MAEFIKWGWAAVTVYIGVFNKALEYDNLVGVGFCEKFFKKKKKKKAKEINRKRASCTLIMQSLSIFNEPN